MKSACAALFLFLLTGSAWAGESVTPYEKRSLSVISDNDAYSSSWRDMYYTAGNRLVYTDRERDYCGEKTAYEKDSSFKCSALRPLGMISLLKGPKATKWDIALAQEIYTPKNENAPAEGIQDYPYAGLLYISAGLTHRNKNTEERLKLLAGVAGPAAMAEQTQKFIHSFLGIGRKMPGWDSQMNNEPVANLYYRITKKYFLLEHSGLGADILPSASAAFGNADIYIAMSGRIRLGYNLDGDFGVSSDDGPADSSTPHDDGFGIYIFAGATGKYVIRNIIINGNTFGHGSGLHMENLTYGFEIGAAVLFKGTRISYTFNRRSREFSSQSSHSEFASIAVQIAF